MNTLVFSLCTDNNYAIPALVSITSIFENHKGHQCKIYVLTSGLEPETTKKFNRLAQTYHQNVVIYTVPEGSFAELKTRHRYRTSMYYRFLLPEIVKEDRVLYLDCDIIVRKDLSTLFDMDMTNVSCGVVEDQNGDWQILHNRIRVDTPYFNSGVMLMNLNFWREKHIRELLIKYILDHPERCYFPDQDALNAVLADSITFLPYTYNFQEQWYWPEDERAISFKKWPEIDKYKDDPAIVHYTWNLKPWHEMCWHCHKDWFLHYAGLHDWIGFRIQPRYRATFLSRCFAFGMKLCLGGIRLSDSLMRNNDVKDIVSFYHIT